MSKLLGLKSWVTLPEAAKHLCNVLGQEVQTADILRLALDGHLKLSVYFVNKAYARCGNVVPMPEAKVDVWETTSSPYKRVLTGICISDEFPKEINLGLREGRLTLTPCGLVIDETKVLEFADTVKSIEGVWDLPMIGAERLDVEHHFQQETGGPAVTLSNLDGAFVESTDGCLCQLQETFDNNPHQPGSLAQLEVLKDKWSFTDQYDSKMQQFKKDRERYLSEKKSESYSYDFYPLAGLPEDSVLVVRTLALADLCSRVAAMESNEYKAEITQKERENLLRTIGALVGILIDSAKGSRFGTTQHPNRSQIAMHIRNYLTSNGLSDVGMKDRVLSERIKQAIDALVDK